MIQIIKKSIIKAFSFDKLAENAIGYTEVKIELIRIEFEQKIQNLSIKFATVAVLAFSFLLMVIFLSFGIIHLINFITDSDQIGYWVMGVFYTLIFFVLVFLKDSDFFNNFIRKLVNSKKNDNH
jgi:uncharacterized membrane protein YqjE